MILLLCGSFEPAEREQWRDALAAAMPGHRLVADVGEVDPARIEVAIVANPPAGSLCGLPSLRLIQSLWAGVDRLLADRTLPPEVPIARMVDPALAAAMVETALWAVLSLHRGFFAYQQRQRQATWRPHAQRRADEIGVTVLGLGAMGLACAAALVQRGYRVAGWTRAAGTSPPMPGLERLVGREALARHLPGSDIVLNLLPLTPDTRGLLDARFFAALPNHASIVNFGRGAHLVETDLLAALDGGQLRHAVLDVFESEPLPAERRFWHHPRVTVLPHVAALTDPRSAAQLVAANVQALVEGRSVAFQVDRVRGY
jgi:glyoxylate/hydroxypyruvate reductase A